MNPDILRSLCRAQTPSIKNTSDALKLCCLNTQSVKNKSDSLADYICENDCDLFGISETWLGTYVDEHVISEMLPSGYDILHVPRQGRNSGYGGVALVYKRNMSVTLHHSSLTSAFRSFEHMECSVKSNGHEFLVVIVYRPPPSKKNGLKTCVFYDEWQNFLDRYSLLGHQVIITGDVNFHLDKAGNNDVRQFMSILESHGMNQHVHSPTHRKGHILDVLITRDVDNVLTSSADVSDPGLCT